MKKSKKEKIEKLISLAESLIGTPYQYGDYLRPKSEKKPKAFDCSSFIQYIYSQVGISLPRSSVLQAAKGQEIKNHKKLLPGDLLFFEGTSGHYNHKLFKNRKIYIGHVALYIGNGEIIHARQSLGSICKQKLITLTKNKNYKIVLAKRIIE